MSLRLWFQSFDWQRLEELIADESQPLVEMLLFEVLSERELAASQGLSSEFEQLPTNTSELEHAIQDIIAADDWYAVIDKQWWHLFDGLLWKAFSKGGFLGAELRATPRTHGVLIETFDVACPKDRLRSETYRMGHRRFRCGESPIYPDDTTDDPCYSIHDPQQVQQIFSEISAFAFASYPDEAVRENFRNGFLEPMRRCSESGLAIVSRWS